MQMLCRVIVCLGEHTVAASHTRREGEEGGLKTEAQAQGQKSRAASLTFVTTEHRAYEKCSDATRGNARGSLPLPQVKSSVKSLWQSAELCPSPTRWPPVVTCSAVGVWYVAVSFPSRSWTRGRSVDVRTRDLQGTRAIASSLCWHCC